jgi:hypothetical protein
MSQTTVLTPLSRQPLSSEKYGLVNRDSGSEIRDTEKTDPASSIMNQKGTGSRIPNLNIGFETELCSIL